MTIENQIAAFFTEERALHAEPLTAPEYRPSAQQIIEWIMDGSGAQEHVVVGWLREMGFSGVTA